MRIIEVETPACCHCNCDNFCLNDIFEEVKECNSSSNIFPEYCPLGFMNETNEELK